MEKNNSFDNYQSQIIKGVAILLMMWHHCFLSGRFEDFNISFYPLTVEQVTLIAAFCKICVSLFAFISGYGLFLSFQKWDDSHPGQGCSPWLWIRYVRTFSGFWLIVLLSWGITGIIDNRPWLVYFRPSRVAGVVYAITDLLGLSNLFGTPTLCATWWYMSTAFFFIIATPVLYLIINRYGATLCICIIMIIPRVFIGYPGGTASLTFLPAFIFGMVFAKENLFDYINTLIPKTCLACTFCYIICIVSFVICFIICKRIPTNKLWDIKWGVFAAIYVLIIFLTISRIPVLRSILAFLGKHSANVFMVHTFLRDTYCRSFIYNRGHFLVIMATLLAMSILVSFLLEGLKRIMRYDCFTEKLESHIFPEN